MSRPNPSAELLAAAKAGDRKAQSALIAASMWIVTARVRMHKGDPDDLTQIALVGDATSGKLLGGLMRAIQTYDPEGGCNWWSYATTWVDSALKHAHKRTRREIRDAPEVSFEAMTEERPIEHAAGTRSGGKRHDAVALAAPSNPERDAGAREHLRKLLTLRPRERRAVIAHLDGCSYKEIGRSMDLGRERARVVTTEAMRKIRGDRKRRPRGKPAGGEA